jgi:SAM-dependent methyltransferase
MPHCLVCNNLTGNREWGRENGYVMLKCGSCGLLFIDRPPEADEREAALKLGLHRGESLLDTNKKADPSRIPLYLETLKAFYPDQLEMKGKKWLDIGAGNGEFVAALQQYFPGLECVAVEPNLQKRNSPYYNGGRVLSGTGVLPAGEKFNVISMLNLWSHLPEPVKFMGELAEILEKDGKLLIQTGNGAEINRYEYPGPLLLPDHLSFAAPGIVSSILHKKGFRLEKLIKYKYPRSRGSLFYIKLFAKYILGKQTRPLGYFTGRFRDCWMRFGRDTEDRRPPARRGGKTEAVVSRK